MILQWKTRGANKSFASCPTTTLTTENSIDNSVCSFKTWENWTWCPHWTDEPRSNRVLLASHLFSMRASCGTKKQDSEGWIMIQMIQRYSKHFTTPRFTSEKLHPKLVEPHGQVSGAAIGQEMFATLREQRLGSPWVARCGMHRTGVNPQFESCFKYIYPLFTTTRAKNHLIHIKHRSSITLFACMMQRQELSHCL